MLTRRADVARALARAGAGGVSGEALGRELGISRVAVGKHVAALRTLGYTIASAPGTGYRLERAPDSCIPETVAPLLADPLWVACEGGPATGSTNDDAKRRARDGAAEGTLVVAARQTGGRGRFGRAWESPPGGAYGSAVLRPALAPSALGPLGLVVAIGVARGLESLGVPAVLKWPNDVLAGDRKLGGILLEMAAEIDRTEWVVAGIGINVAVPAFGGASNVREWAPDVTVAEAAAAAFDAVAGAYREFAAAGFGPLAGEYRDRGTLWGREIQVHDAAGGLVVSGVATDIDCSGALVVSGADGERAIVAGEVTLRPTR